METLVSKQGRDYPIDPKPVAVLWVQFSSRPSLSVSLQTTRCSELSEKLDCEGQLWNSLGASAAASCATVHGRRYHRTHCIGE